MITLFKKKIIFECSGWIKMTKNGLLENSKKLLRYEKGIVKKKSKETPKKETKKEEEILS